jgi:hypothetical protein
VKWQRINTVEMTLTNTPGDQRRDAQQPRQCGRHGGEAVGPRAVLKAALFAPSEFHQKTRSAFYGQTWRTPIGPEFRADHETSVNQTARKPRWLLAKTSEGVRYRHI